ncbi:MAG TPA: hypothetical protein VKH40_12870 [Alloacidobacterium sp.]|nr:hypothetical protein [Alloacidobacterium sp.]
MLNLNIDSLALNITNAEGHEHRIRPIATRAAAIFAERVEVYCGENAQAPGSKSLSSVSASPVNVDLHTMTDEHAAQSIARSWLDAVKLKLM